MSTFQTEQALEMFWSCEGEPISGYYAIALT